MPEQEPTDGNGLIPHQYHRINYQVMIRVDLSPSAAQAGKSGLRSQSAVEVFLAIVFVFGALLAGLVMLTFVYNAIERLADVRWSTYGVLANI